MSRRRSAKRGPDTHGPRGKKSSTVDFLGREKLATREIPTPEGVTLTFEIAPAGDRFAAFFLDYLILTALALLLGWLLTSTLSSDDAAVAGGFLAFFVRHGYFNGSEILWRGRTLGKRAQRIQVIDRQGGPLRVEAIFARNLTRDLELFLPILVMLSGGAISIDLPEWGRPLVFVWVLFFAFFPLFNRERQRFGDLLAGTIVVRSPKLILARDLGTPRDIERQSGAAPAFTFTREQLEKYGIYELQVLEKVLRQKDVRLETLHSIVSRIQKKIGYTGKTRAPRRFLEEFYRAQRAFLEGRMLMGDKREDKNAVADARTAHRRPPPPPPSAR